MNFKIILLAIVLSVLLVDAVPSRRGRSASHGRRQKHQKKCHEVTTTTTSTTTTSTSTTTPIPTTTTLAPNTTACSNIVRLNSTSGAFLKTICLMPNFQDIAKAADFCKTNHMTLMRMTDYESVNGFNNFINQKYGGILISFILNGYRNTTGSDWVLYTDPSTSLYSGFAWDTRFAAVFKLPLASIYKKLANGTYYAEGQPLLQHSNVVCEFI